MESSNIRFDMIFLISMNGRHVIYNVIEGPRVRDQVCTTLSVSKFPWFSRQTHTVQHTLHHVRQHALSGCYNRRTPLIHSSQHYR
jgi:hypothetical protein